MTNCCSAFGTGSEGDWLCPNCLAQESDAYCFKDGQEHTLPEFEAIASSFKQEYIPLLAQRLGKSVQDVTWRDLEKDFWQIVECGDEPVEVRPLG